MTRRSDRRGARVARELESFGHATMQLLDYM